MDEEYMNRFDEFQKEEIRKGMCKGLDVELYADPKYPYGLMRQLRKGLEVGYNLKAYADYGVGVLYELRRALDSGISLISYIEEGYDAEQLNAIRHALEKGIRIRPYLNPLYRGSCINEIAIGLAHRIDVTAYAVPCYTWRKMKEIRKGIEQHLDIRQYADPMYSYWQMREIRLGLKDGLDVSSYKSMMYTAKEMRRRRLMQKRKKNAPQMSGEWTILSDTAYDICISPDGLSAYFNWHCKRAVRDVEELENILRDNGVVYGIRHSALAAIAKEYHSISDDSVKDHNTLVARGLPAVHGSNGYYEWKFAVKTPYSPKLSEDGSIVFDGFNWFESVKKGQVLAVYHYAGASADGKTVMGKRIVARIGKEKPSLSGKGFELLSDLKTYVSTVDGHVRLMKNELVVEELLMLDGIDSSNDLLTFDGNVYVKGNIEGPVTMLVKGDLVVDGSVEGAQINCEGNLLLKRGINNISAPGPVCVKGCVISKFFEYTALQAEENIYFGTSLNSNLFTYGEMVSFGKKGGIMGGSSYSEKGFCLSNLGNCAGAPTTLCIGTNENIRTLKVDAENQIAQLKGEISQLMKERNREVSRWGVSERLSRMEETLVEKGGRLKTTSQLVLNLKKRDERASRSAIVAEQVFDNVQIRYQNIKITPTASSQVVIRVKDEKLIMEKLYKNMINMEYGKEEVTYA